MFNISLLADIEEEEVVDQAAKEATDDQEEVVDIEEEIVDEAAKEEVVDEQPAPAEEVKAEPTAEAAQEEAPVEAEAPKAEEVKEEPKAEEVKAEEAPKAEEAAPAEAPVEKPTEEEITEDAKAEVAEAEEGGDIEVKDTEVLAESQILSAQFDELLAMQRHVAKFGVDRTFLSLFNKGGRLGRALGVNIPACESIDAVGYPTSPLSLACLEAFDNKEKGVVAKIVDFIVALLKKIKNLAARFWTWLSGLLDNQASKWNKLQAISKNRVIAKNVDKEVTVPAIGVEIDADLGKRLQGLGFFNILKTLMFVTVGKINTDNWNNGTNARKLAEQIAIVEQNMAKTAAVTGKNAGATLKRLASNIRVSFKEMDQVKKVLAGLNEKIKFAEKEVDKAKNGVDKSVNLENRKGGVHFAFANYNKNGTNLTFGSGDKEAVKNAKNSLIDLKARQTIVQKVASVYTRCIRVMLRSYANVLFSLTNEKA